MTFNRSRGPRGRKVYSLTAIIIGTFVLFVIFSNLQTLWIAGETSSGTLLDNENYCVYEPEVVMDDNGNAIAVWYQYDGSYLSIYANVYSNGSWGVATLLEHNEGEARSPQIAMNGSGHAIVTWFQEDGTGVFSIYYCIYSDGSWGEAMLLENEKGNASSSYIAMNDDGDVVAVWCQYDDSDILNMYASSYVNGSWTAQISLDDSMENSPGLGVAMSDNGDAVAIWYRINDWNHKSIYASMYSNGSWGGATLLDIDGGEFHIDAVVSMDSEGNAIAVWSRPNGTYVWDIYADVYTNGSWEGAALLDDGDGNAYSPEIAMNGNGDAIVVWYQESGSASIYASSYSNGSWGEARIIENVTGYAYYPHIAMNDDGCAAVIWYEDPGSGDCSIYTSSYSSGSWGGAILIGDDEGEVYYEGVAMNENGDMVFIWCRGDIERLSIYASPNVEGDLPSSTNWIIMSIVVIVVCASVTSFILWRRRAK
jgi:hypothetical protein